MLTAVWRLLFLSLWRLFSRLQLSLWRLENGLTLTSGTEAELTAGSMEPSSPLELDICLQNLRSLKSPLALAAATAAFSALNTTDMTPLGPPALARLDEVLEAEMTPVTADVGALEAGDTTEAGLLTSSSSLSLVSL